MLHHPSKFCWTFCSGALVILLLNGLCLTPVAIGAEDGADRSPVTIRVVDDAKEPIAKATLSVMSWIDGDDQRTAPLETTTAVCDERGEGTIDVPAGVKSAAIRVVAKGFAKPDDIYALTGKITIAMQPGRIVRVRAVDEQGNPVPDAVPMLEDCRHWPREFEGVEGEPGVFVSPVVALNRHWMRVVAGNEEGPNLYSSLIDVRKADDDRRQVTILATLRRGIRLEGRLDESVPRPVGDGVVELFITEGQGHKIGTGTAWAWQDSLAIRPDGTFVAPSLPAGGHVQLVAVLDGYHSTKPSAAELQDYLVQHEAGDPALVDAAAERSDAFWPHLFPLPADRPLVNVELPCRPAAALDVLVVDPLGNVMENAEVAFNPNGYFLGGELFIPGTEVFTQANRVRKNFRVNDSPLRQWASRNFLQVKTDAEGIARVRSLPADTRESFRVRADEFVMPVYPTSSADREMRYGIIELIGGEVLSRTVTMERAIERSMRNLAIMDSDGKPLPDLEVTVTELSFDVSPDHWELWATQRFGEVVTARSQGDGGARLRVPTRVDGSQVAQLRVVIRGRVGEEAYVQSEDLVVPVTDDGQVVLVSQSDEAPRPGRFRETTLRYVDPNDAFAEPPHVVLQKLIDAPSIATLKRLLHAAEFDRVTPLDFCEERNLLAMFSGAPERSRRAVVPLTTEEGERVVVLCDVRPQDADWDVKPEGRFPPEAAFVFDPADGRLLAMLGGWKSANNDYCDLFLTNLGGTDDYFVAVGASEDHGPFGKRAHWYRLGDETKPALTTYNHFNATAWSGTEGPAEPLAEYGYLEYAFNGRDLENRDLGVTTAGALVPRKIYWDGLRNRFIGPLMQTFEGEPLYRIDMEKSAAFEPLEVAPGQIVVGGGRRDYENWHSWNVVIPAEREGAAKLVLVDRRTDERREETLAVSPLTAGWHHLQLHIADVEDDEDKSHVEIRIDAMDRSAQPKMTAPRVPIAAVASVEEASVVRAANERLPLFDRQTAADGLRLEWRVELRPKK